MTTPNPHTPDTTSATNVWTDEGGASTHGPATHIPAPRESGEHVSPGVSAHSLVDITETDLEVAAGAQDLRTFAVVDRDGEKLGTVDSLLIDSQTHHVRLLQIGSGGFLGWGRLSRLVPVEAITRVDEADETVYIDSTRDHVTGTPAYDPELEQLSLDWNPYLVPYGLGPVPVASRPGIGRAIR